MGIRRMEEWSLLRISPQKQCCYLSLLQEYFPDVISYYPIYRRRKRPHGARRPVEVEMPVFPGYVFLQTDDLWGPVHLPVRAAWVRFGGEVETVPSIVITRLRRLEANNELVREVRYVNPYTRGTPVMVHLEVQDIQAVIVKLVHGHRAQVDTKLCRFEVPLHKLECL